MEIDEVKDAYVSLPLLEHFISRLECHIHKSYSMVSFLQQKKCDKNQNLLLMYKAKSDTCYGAMIIRNINTFI